MGKGKVAHDQGEARAKPLREPESLRRRIAQPEATPKPGDSSQLAGERALSDAILVTEHKRLEEEIRRQNKLVGDLLDAIPHPFLVLDAADYTIKLANSAARRTYSWDSGTTCYAAIHGRGAPCEFAKPRCPLEEAKRTKQPALAQHTHHDQHGEPMEVEVHAFPVLDEQGRVAQVIHQMVDITDRKLAAEQLQSYQEELRLLASRLALAEENERRRIAMDLHDVAAQDLALAMMRVRELQETWGRDDAREGLDEIHGLIEETTLQLRSLSRSLSPPALYEVGLEAALESLAERFQAEQGIPCQFEDDGRAKPLEEDATKTLHRCVRELLANVARHADARNVSIAISRSDHTVEVVVSDDGKGFDARPPRLSLAPSGGFGLFSVQEGMRALGGELEIDSQPGCGTRATLTMPVGGMREPE